VQQLAARDRLSAAPTVKVATVETPTHLLGWLPILWTRMLFAGAAAPTEPMRVGPGTALFVLSGVLLFPACRFRCSSLTRGATPDSSRDADGGRMDRADAAGRSISRQTAALSTGW